MSIQSKSFLSAGASLLLTGLLLGCAGGGFELSDAALSGNPDAMWAEGQRAVTEGERMVNEGEERLTEGRTRVRDGEARVSDGNRRVLQSRQDYIDAAAVAGGSTTPEQVEEESKRLRSIGKRWEDAIDEIRDGNRLVERGNEDINRGQEEIRQGRILMDQGSTLMRNSQRSRMGDDLLPDTDATFNN